MCLQQFSLSLIWNVFCSDNKGLLHSSIIIFQKYFSNKTIQLKIFKKNCGTFDCKQTQLKRLAQSDIFLFFLACTHFISFRLK
jgi:hypothetical protein